MTTTITVAAHCNNESEVQIEIWDAQTKYPYEKGTTLVRDLTIQNGDTSILNIWGSQFIIVKEQLKESK